tara:strand:+ start:609 stop:914 length:306 start_codon:yes stop_codon:yes gene_type:complete
MATTIRQGFVTGSGSVLDVASSVAVANTRIRNINASGVGTFLITGTSTNQGGQIRGNNIKFVNTTANDVNDIYLPDLGVLMVGEIKVSAPTSASTVAIFYG